MCYQQAGQVVLALESIRYQNEHYGQGRAFQLIAADDGSTDGSQTAIRRWLERHGGLFARVDLLFHEKNGGICRNYVDALRQVEGHWQDCGAHYRRMAAEARSIPADGPAAPEQA